eukprot:1461512-Rhodomonas_salina.2
MHVTCRTDTGHTYNTAVVHITDIGNRHIRRVQCSDLGGPGRDVDWREAAREGGGGSGADRQTDRHTDTQTRTDTRTDTQTHRHSLRDGPVLT